ncbi:MAG: SDR family oxidoreductase [Rhizobiaceae bacterium]|nr:SDR family oxidoreductase [Rhizobiaceae bacterium]
MARLLITGGSGLLALNWARCMSDLWDVQRIEHHRRVELMGTVSHQIDIGSQDALARLLDIVAPDVVVNCAGMTGVEQCEADREAARRANVSIPRTIAAACRGRPLHLVHISTDHLFDGTVSMATETEPPRPVNVYARSKADGEKAVLDTLEDALVVRTNFFGWGTGYKASFSDRIVGALRAGEKTGLFEDVYFTPILMDTLAETVHGLVSSGASGIYNVAGDERLSKYEFGLRIAEMFGLDSTLIQRSKLSVRSDLVTRPLEMSLSNNKARRLLGRELGGASAHMSRLTALESDPRVKEVQAL